MMHSGDITRSWTVVRGGTKSKPEKVYNRNGLAYHADFKS